MFMMMMVVVVMILLVELHAKLVHGMKISQYTKRFASYENNKCIKIDINKYNKTRGDKQISPITQKKNHKIHSENKQTNKARQNYCRAGSTTKFVISTHFIDKKFNLFNYLSVFDICLFDVKNSMKMI
jgi:hypothetical protein